MLNTQMTLYEAFTDVARSRPNQTALICGDLNLTYGQLLENVHGLTIGLQARGLKKGDHVVCMLPPGSDYALLFFAVAQMGAVFIPLNPQIRSMGITDVLQDANPQILISARKLSSQVFAGITRPPQVLYANADVDRNTDISTLIAESSSGPLPDCDVSPGDLAVLLYTSGTTGKPKATMHTHSSLIAPVVASIKIRELWLKKPGLKTLGRSIKALSRYKMRLLRAAGKPQTILSTASWHTITGLELMLQALLMGDRLVVMPRFHPRKALELVEREQVTVLVAIPMAYRVMLSLNAFDEFDTSSLLICATGAAPCPADLAHEIQNRFGCALHIGFGATETAGGIAATSISDTNDQQAETVGHPMPGMQIKIVDDERRELPPGTVGELACRSDSIMLGYYQDPEQTAQVMDDEGWFYTGDLAVMDENGYIRIVGRKTDMIIRAGQNVYPEEIEAFLLTHPQIREAAVVGVPAKIEGEAVWAFIIPERPQGLDEREALQYCRDVLEPYKIPARVVVMEDFPRSETGKPQKYKLREAVLGANDSGGNHES